MAGKLSFQFELLGLDKTIKDLRLLSRELDSIARKARSIGNINIGVNGGSSSALRGGMGAGLLGATAALMLSNGGKKQNLLGPPNILNLPHVGLPAEAWKSMIALLGGRTMSGLEGQLGLPGIPAGDPQLKKREHIVGAPGMGGGAGGGGEGGGGGMFSGFFENFPKLAAVASTVWAAFEGLKKAAELLINAFERGAEAFQTAAKLGTDVGTTSQIHQALQAIGISEQATTRMMLQFEMNSRKGRAVGIPGTNEFINVSRASQFGSAQQLTNMAEEFKTAMELGAAAARQTKQSAGANLIITMLWKDVLNELKDLISQLTAAFFPLIAAALGLADAFLKMANLIAEGVIRLEHILGLPVFEPGKSRLGGVDNILPHANTWQNIGFAFKGGGPEKKLSEIADNTKKTVSAIETLGKQIGGVVGGRMTGTVALPGLP